LVYANEQLQSVHDEFAERVRAKVRAIKDTLEEMDVKRRLQAQSWEGTVRDGILWRRSLHKTAKELEQLVDDAGADLQLTP